MIPIESRKKILLAVAPPPENYSLVSFAEAERGIFDMVKDFFGNFVDTSNPTKAITNFITPTLIGQLVKTIFDSQGLGILVDLCLRLFGIDIYGLIVEPICNWFSSLFSGGKAPTTNPASLASSTAAAIDSHVSSVLDSVDTSKAPERLAREVSQSAPKPPSAKGPVGLAAEMSRPSSGGLSAAMSRSSSGNLADAMAYLDGDQTIIKQAQWQLLLGGGLGAFIIPKLFSFLGSSKEKDPKAAEQASDSLLGSVGGIFSTVLGFIFKALLMMLFAGGVNYLWHDHFGADTTPLAGKSPVLAPTTSTQTKYHVASPLPSSVSAQHTHPWIVDVPHHEPNNDTSRRNAIKETLMSWTTTVYPSVSKDINKLKSSSKLDGLAEFILENNYQWDLPDSVVMIKGINNIKAAVDYFIDEVASS